METRLAARREHHWGYFLTLCAENDAPFVKNALTFAAVGLDAKISTLQDAACGIHIDAFGLLRRAGSLGART